MQFSQDSQFLGDEEDDMVLSCIDLPPPSPPPDDLEYDSDTLEDTCPNNNVVPVVQPR